MKLAVALQLTGAAALTAAAVVLGLIFSGLVALGAGLAVGGGLVFTAGYSAERGS